MSRRCPTRRNCRNYRYKIARKRPRTRLRMCRRKETRDWRTRRRCRWCNCRCCISFPLRNCCRNYPNKRSRTQCWRPVCRDMTVAESMPAVAKGSGFAALPPAEERKMRPVPDCTCLAPGSRRRRRKYRTCLWHRCIRRSPKRRHWASRPRRRNDWMNFPPNRSRKDCSSFDSLNNCWRLRY